MAKAIKKTSKKVKLMGNARRDNTKVEVYADGTPVKKKVEETD